MIAPPTLVDASGVPYMVDQSAEWACMLGPTHDTTLLVGAFVIGVVLGMAIVLTAWTWALRVTRP